MKEGKIIVWSFNVFGHLYIRALIISFPHWTLFIWLLYGLAQLKFPFCFLFIPSISGTLSVLLPPSSPNTGIIILSSRNHLYSSQFHEFTHGISCLMENISPTLHLTTSRLSFYPNSHIFLREIFPNPYSDYSFFSVKNYSFSPASSHNAKHICKCFFQCFIREESYRYIYRREREKWYTVL